MNNHDLGPGIRESCLLLGTILLFITIFPLSLGFVNSMTYGEWDDEILYWCKLLPSIGVGLIILSIILHIFVNLLKLDSKISGDTKLAIYMLIIGTMFTSLGVIGTLYGGGFYILFGIFGAIALGMSIIYFFCKLIVIIIDKFFIK